MCGLGRTVTAQASSGCAVRGVRVWGGATRPVTQASVSTVY